ncbi:hypothetical protein MMC32_008254 [Xylographa parallela]|nr:hypothetical protein [Xylographa parallela]
MLKEIQKPQHDGNKQECENGFRKEQEDEQGVFEKEQEARLVAFEKEQEARLVAYQKERNDAFEKKKAEIQELKKDIKELGEKCIAQFAEIIR